MPCYNKANEKKGVIIIAAAKILKPYIIMAVEQNQRGMRQLNLKGGYVHEYGEKA